MFDIIAYVALAGVVIWGAVSLIKHFVPDYYAKMDDRFNTGLHARLTAIEEHLGITTNVEAVVKPTEDKQS